MKIRASFVKHRKWWIVWTEDVLVSVLVGSIADGDSVGDLLAAYPPLTAEDIQAALKFAAEAASR